MKERKQGALGTITRKDSHLEEKRVLICKELNAQGTLSEGGSTGEE